MYAFCPESGASGVNPAASCARPPAGAATSWSEERGFRGRPDLVDRERRLVIEAESFDFHGRRRVKHDCERFTGLVSRGWTVVRSAWAHGMYEQDYVRNSLVALAEGPSRRAALPPVLLRSA